jgi:GNAT superfamily N-acetyltransferase
MIRPAVAEDLDKVMPLIYEFKDESLKDYGVDINTDLIKSTVSKYLGSTFVAEDEGKIIAILAGYLTYYPTISTPVYQEEIWYSAKDYRYSGVKLLKHLEEWCKNRGVSHIIMGSMINSCHAKLTDFYIKLGFIPMQVQYIKVLGGSNALPQ